MERDAKSVVRLDELERGRLQEMVDRGEGSKTIRNRALILLRADEGERGPSWVDTKIAEAFDVGVRTVERTRRLLVTEGFEAVLAREPSPNRRYRKLDGVQEAELVKLACSTPPAGRARRTLQMLADRLVERQVVASIGREAVRTTPQKPTSSRGGGSSGFFLPRRTPRSPREEDVLDVYQRAYDARRPVVCLDEPSKQLIRETRAPAPARPGQPERVDYEYERDGTANLFVAFEPLAGRRRVKVTDRRTKVDFAHVIRELADEQYPKADKVVLVMDNLNTHKPSSLYEAFTPDEARRLIGRLEVHHTPKHGSWRNTAETELSVLSSRCLDRRIGEKDELRSEVAAWEHRRNTAKCRVDWQFTTVGARVKLKRLYPSIQTG